MSFWKKYRTEYVNLLRLGAPVFVTQVGIIVVNFADTMMVGGYGTRELAAAAFVNSLFVVMMVMQIGFSSGITPLVGALFGKGDAAEAGRTLRAGVQVNLALSVVFTAIMAVLYFHLHRFGQPEELLPLIRAYYPIIAATLIPLSVFNCCQQTANGINDTATPMWMILGANVVNIFGNWLLIYGKLGCPELGLVGAGISTLTSRIVATVGIIAVFLLGKRYRPYMEGYRSARQLAPIRRKVWLTSYPIMIQNGVECFLWSFGAIVSGWFGKVQLAAYQVVNTIAQLGFMTYLSFGTATSIRVANFMGQRDIPSLRRITVAGLHINLVLCTVASLIFFFLGEPLIRVFTPDPAVIAVALLLVPPLILYQYGDAVQLTYACALRGTSVVKPLLWISLTSYVVVGVPFLLFMARTLGLEGQGIYLSYTGSLTLAAILLIRSYRRAVRSKEREFAA